ncbi:hypothetical protein [Leifsonia sp. RAF41]|uniref:hypothetical protein n=1 Tax=Leifsonia sp. RAF41 TaxID=3233056 RepID=UPI003F94AD89
MSKDDLDWQDEFNKAQHSQLTAVRASAEKWAGGIAAVVGAFATFSVILAPQKLADMSDDGLKIVVLVFAAAAGALGTVALIQATLAASGSPSLDYAATWEIYRDDVKREAAAAARKLRASRHLTWGAIIAIVAAALTSQVSTLVPHSADSNFIIVSKNGEVMCGALTTRDGVVLVAGKPVRDAASISAVDGCGSTKP